MSDDAEVLDSLSRAIVEFREEILLWIDTALVRLREREQDESVAMEERSAPATLTRWGTESGSQTPLSDQTSRRATGRGGAPSCDQTGRQSRTTRRSPGGIRWAVRSGRTSLLREMSQIPSRSPPRLIHSSDWMHLPDSWISGSSCPRKRRQTAPGRAARSGNRTVER